MTTRWLETGWKWLPMSSSGLVFSTSRSIATDIMDIPSWMIPSHPVESSSTSEPMQSYGVLGAQTLHNSILSCRYSLLWLHKVAQMFLPAAGTKTQGQNNNCTVALFENCFLFWVIYRACGRWVWIKPVGVRTKEGLSTFPLSPLFVIISIFLLPSSRPFLSDRKPLFVVKKLLTFSLLMPWEHPRVTARR